MVKRFSLFISVFFCFVAAAQDKPAYKIFTDEGKEVRYDKMIRRLGEGDVILFGELHNNAIAHWLQLQVVKSLYAKNEALAVGMEMFEADDQVVLDEYLNGVIDEKAFLREAKTWDNYKTDYKPVVDFARKNNLRVVATNIPRRYANLVYRKGLPALDSLSDQSKAWIAPLPVEVDLQLPGYRKMIEEMGGHGGSGSAENLAASQAIKDATMAHFILANRDGGVRFVHLNGNYHSQDGEGIVWYLRRSDPNLVIMTIHVAEQDDVKKLEGENKGKADFVICVPADMTKTY